MSMRPLVAFLPLLLLAGCANPTAEDTDAPSVEADDVNPTALGGPLDTSVAADGPVIAQCQPPAVDVAHELELGPFWWSAQGAVSVSSACDRFVVEVTGILGAKEVVLESSSVGPYPAVGNQTNCEASTMSANVRGEIPGRWVWQSGQFTWDPPHWENISTLIEHGKWTGSSCSFPWFMQGTRMGIPGGEIDNSPYARIRVATRSVLQTPSGPVASTIKTRAIWYQ